METNDQQQELLGALVARGGSAGNGKQNLLAFIWSMAEQSPPNRPIS